MVGGAISFLGLLPDTPLEANMLDRFQGVSSALCAKLTASAKDRPHSFNFHPWTSVEDTVLEANKLL